MIGAVVEEGNEAGVVGDELVEGGPGVEGPVIGVFWGDVGVGDNAALVEGVVEVGDGEVIAVCEQDGDNFSRVLVKPLLDYLEVVLQEAGVFHDAGGVAQR